MTANDCNDSSFRQNSTSTLNNAENATEDTLQQNDVTLYYDKELTMDPEIPTIGTTPY